MAETYYSLTDIVKLCDNLIAAMPTSFYSGIMAVRGGLAAIPAADVVARDCYDRLLAENDELRKERPVVRCGECYYWEESSAITHIGNCKFMQRLHTGRFFCGNGTRKDGDEV